VPSGYRQQIAAVALMGLIVAIAIAALPFGRVALPANSSFLPAFGTLTFGTDLVTGFLLLSQARVANDRGPLRLAVAYLFSAMTIVPHLLAFPGVVAASPIIGASASAVWLWAAWHGGFGALVLAFALGQPRKLQQRDIIIAMTILTIVVTALAVAATAGLPWLPIILVNGNFQRLISLGIGPAVLAVTVLATVAVMAKHRFRDPLSLWLSVSMLAASLDVALTLFGGDRYTLGWYVARMLSLVTGVTVLTALLCELVMQAGRVAEVNGALEAMLRTDVLTGLYNRRAFNTAIATEWRRSRREQIAVSLVMIDIDMFKGFNDRYGHPAGDQCLRLVAAALDDQTRRPGDLAARLGGEEFVILLPNTEEAGAIKVAERVRACVEALGLAHAGSPRGHVTISVGVATSRPFDWSDEPAGLIDAADRALYRAKAGGRNTVCAAVFEAPALQVA
jgi:diguanylate cyclase (GGDEF)-like protein